MVYVPHRHRRTPFKLNLSGGFSMFYSKEKDWCGIKCDIILSRQSSSISLLLWLGRGFWFKNMEFVQNCLEFLLFLISNHFQIGSLLAIPINSIEDESCSFLFLGHQRWKVKVTVMVILVSLVSDLSEKKIVSKEYGFGLK